MSATLQRLQDLGSLAINELSMYYGSLFPMEIRYQLSKFLESRLQNVHDPSEINPQFESCARKFLSEFIEELELQAMCTVNQDSVKMLNETAESLKLKNATDVYSYLIKCIQFEQQLLNQTQTVTSNEVAQVNAIIENFTITVDETCNMKIQWDKHFEAYQKENCDMSLTSVSMDVSCDPEFELEMHIKKQALEYQLNNLNIGRSNLLANFKSCFEKADALTRKIVDEYLKYWRWYQKFYGNGVVINDANLKTIQGWCEKLAEGLMRVEEVLRMMMQNSQIQFEFQNCSNEDGVSFTSMFNKTVALLQKLVNGSFIIEIQPPQILKANTKFTAKLNLLTGKLLELTTSKPIVKASIINESQAKVIYQTNKLSDPPIGSILNDVRVFEVNSNENEVFAIFSQMKLGSFKRSERKSTKSVADEKFSILFRSSFKIRGIDFDVYEMSLPAVLTVHGVQEAQACATIFWDNSFSVVDRIPFEVPVDVTWKEFSECLNQKFVSTLNRGLLPEDLHFLAEKLFNEPLPFPVPNDLTVSWENFCKDLMPERPFTFWEWTHAAMKLLKDHLPRIWEDGLIVGFISKAKVEEKLMASSVPGTFMLRFSDSELGSISVAWFTTNFATPVVHIQPFNGKDFDNHSLPDLLNGVEGLEILYPNIPKAEAYQRFSKNSTHTLQTTPKSVYIPVQRILVLMASTRENEAKSGSDNDSRKNF